MTLNKRTVVISCISAFAVYTLVFLLSVKFPDEVRFEGDEMFFQSIAVNFAKGHGFPKVGGIEDFKEYSSSAFKTAKKRGWLSVITSHLKHRNKNVLMYEKEGV